MVYQVFINIIKSLNQCKEGTLFWLPLLPGSQALLPDPADGNGEARGCAEAGGRTKTWSHGDFLRGIPSSWIVSIKNGNWKWPFIVDFPIKNGDFLIFSISMDWFKGKSEPETHRYFTMTYSVFLHFVPLNQSIDNSWIVSAWCFGTWFCMTSHMSGMS